MPAFDFANATFAVDDGYLVMTALPRSGKRYRHTCSMANFQKVAEEVGAAGPDGLTRDALQERTQVPWSQIQVAINFLDERSIVEHKGRRGRLIAPGTADLLLDALTEYHALRELPDGEP